jgi:uncharacterized protein YjbI with pentapeptide repeats
MVSAMTSQVMGPRAHTTAEIRFFISLHSCPGCGARVDPSGLTFYGQDTACAFTGYCRRCRAPLAFRFRTYGDPVRAPCRPGELGDDQPSEIIRPGDFVAEIDRLSPLVQPDPTRLALEEWRASRDANSRLLTCLAEIGKFIPPGADAIPDERLSLDELATQARRPEVFRHAWLDEQRARHLTIRERVIADIPRIDALETAARPYQREVGTFDRDALRAHEAWIRRGRTGRGRLVLVGVDAAGEDVGAAELTGARLSWVDFTGIDLSYATIDDAELREVNLTGANLTSTSFRGATIRGGSFVDAHLALAKFERAAVAGARFGGSDLDRSQWQGAQVRETDFDGAHLGNAQLDGAVFTTCSFRSADFAPTTPAPPATTRDTRFVNCDLRGTRWQDRDLAGAVFVHCKLAQISGRPKSLDGIVIEAPDLSSGGDGSDIGEPADILIVWG